jgi:diguanylate cyclase (GGDEF)-like protein
MAEGDLEFRMRSVQAGVGLTAFACLFFTLYYLATPTQPHRVGLLCLTAGTLTATALILCLPLRAIIQRPVAREAFFLGWALAIIAILTLTTVLDGGVGSPAAFAYFLPLLFAALSYPAASTAVVGAVNVAAYLGTALTQGGAPAAEVALVAMTLAASTWLCAWQARSHERHRRELARVSRTDPLTGVLNRRGFDERFTAELRAAERTGLPVALMLVDLDEFKLINDRHGHAAGDDLLRWAARTMTATLRAGDAVGRIGGDEFAALVPGVEGAAAGALARRLRAALAERSPASIGVALAPADGTTAAALQQVADLELYAVKHERTVETPAADARDLHWATGLALASDDRMSGAGGHAETVARHAITIGERLGLDEHRLALLRVAALLHDVGKLAVPEELLRRPGPLTAAERRVVEGHAATGADILARVPGYAPLARWVRHSHEHYDGSGYPDRLRGDDIPLEARIILVADAFDAMTSGRPYRPAIAIDAALAELRRWAGRQFDPTCVEVLADAVAPRRGTPTPGPQVTV